MILQLSYFCLCFCCLKSGFVILVLAVAEHDRNCSGLECDLVGYRQELCDDIVQSVFEGGFATLGEIVAIFSGGSKFCNYDNHWRNKLLQRNRTFGDNN